MAEACKEYNALSLLGMTIFLLSFSRTQTSNTSSATSRTGPTLSGLPRKPNAILIQFCSFLPGWHRENHEGSKITILLFQIRE